MIVVLIVET